MRKKNLLIALIFLPLFLQAVTIHIKNDSIYSLTATIYDKKGDKINTSELFPNQVHTWIDSLSGAENWETGPFKIVFTCQNGDLYGTIKDVNDGFTVTTRSAIGPKRCGK